MVAIVVFHTMYSLCSAAGENTAWGVPYTPLLFLTKNEGGKMTEKFDENFSFENDDLLKELAEYLETGGDEDQNDYKINRPQWTKMTEIIDYLVNRFPATRKSLEPNSIIPSLKSGCVTIVFGGANLKDPLEIVDFADAIMRAYRVTIDATTDGTVMIEAVVPEVFIPKDEEEHEVL